MAIELHVVGPGLDVLRQLGAGEKEIVLGRDSDCDIRLPDPQRNVSRRHLALWVDGADLHFHVLSVVNGIEMPFGEAPPGARGVLRSGETLKVAEYTVTAALAPEAAPAADPWSVFDRDGSGTTQMPPVAHGQPAEEDPFGEWGFETTGEKSAERSAGTSGSSGSMTQAYSAPVAGDLQALLRGLGLDPAVVGPLASGELESIGKLIRSLAVGMLELQAAATGVKKNLHAEDRTMVASKDNNPLKTDWPLDTKLRYLFGGRAGGVGLVNPEKALTELLAEMMAHELATAAATRTSMEAVLKDFSPDALRNRLLGQGPKLFEGARAWDAYRKHFEENGQDFARWAQRLLDRHFTEAYLRESQRIKRETGPRRH
jgi:predicted component of type VI protein secretion system